MLLGYVKKLLDVINVALNKCSLYLGDETDKPNYRSDSVKLHGHCQM